MASRANISTMLGVVFVPTILTIVLCVAKWNQHDNGELVYKWMEMGFFITIFFRLVMTVELCLASKIGLNFCGKLADFCVKHVIIPALYMIYPCIWAWIFISICWWCSTSEKDQLPQGGLKWCFFIILVICCGEVFGFIDSCVEKHMAERQSRILCAEQGIPISDNKTVIKPNNLAVNFLDIPFSEK